MGRTKKKKHRKGFGLIAVVVLLLCGVVSYKKIGLDAKNVKSMEEIKELEKQKQGLLDEQKDIEDYQAYVQTKKYIEEIARQKLGLVYQDEIIFKTED